MTYLPDTEAIRVLCARLKDAGERLVEVSRFALLTGHGSLRLARHMVEAITAIVFFDWGVEHAVWCCDSSHKAFYALYGFRPLEGTTEGDFLGLGVRSFCVYASVAEVPGRLRGRLIAKARIHSRLGCIPYEAKSGRVDYGAQPEDVRRTQPAFASL
jgi:hypothetical protein